MCVCVCVCKGILSVKWMERLKPFFNPISKTQLGVEAKMLFSSLRFNTAKLQYTAALSSFTNERSPKGWLVYVVTKCPCSDELLWEWAGGGWCNWKHVVVAIRAINSCSLTVLCRPVVWVHTVLGASHQSFTSSGFFFWKRSTHSGHEVKGISLTQRYDWL